MNFWNSVEYFSESEFMPFPAMNEISLIRTLDRLRKFASEIISAPVPIVILASAAKSGHAPDSYHYRGLAADIYFKISPSVFSFREQFLAIKSFSNINGIGFYPEWNPSPGFHIDLRDPIKSALWIRKNNKYIYEPKVFYQAISDRSLVNSVNSANSFS